MVVPLGWAGGVPEDVKCSEISARCEDAVWLAISGVCLVHFRGKGKPVSAWRGGTSCVCKDRIEGRQQQQGHQYVECPHGAARSQNPPQRTAEKCPDQR